MHHDYCKLNLSVLPWLNQRSCNSGNVYCSSFDYYYISSSVHMLWCDPIMANSSSYLDIRVKDCARCNRKRKKWAKTSSGRLHAQINLYIAFSKISATLFDNRTSSMRTILFDHIFYIYNTTNGWLARSSL